MTAPNQGIYEVFNNRWPTSNKARCLTFMHDLSSAGTATFIYDFVFEEGENDLEFIQAIAVNNLANAAALNILVGATQQNLTIPIGKQAILPLFAPIPTRIKISSAVAAGVLIPIHLLNTAQASIVW